ncbi:MAG: amino acid ABC transporter permease [Cellulosilyticaceae bacterium]
MVCEIMEWLIQTTLQILEGLGTTLSLYVITICFSLVFGMMLAVGKISIKNKIVSKCFDIYTMLFRGTPLLLQLYFFYFGLRGIMFTFGDYQVRPFAVLSAFSCALIAFILNYAAYFAEIFRGGIQAVDKGQTEASKALGMTYVQTMIYVVVPQGIRSVLPSLANESITLVKDTALVAAIAIEDLLRNSKDIVVRDGNLMPFVIVGVIYLMLSYVIGMVFKYLEKRQNVKYL